MVSHRHVLHRKGFSSSVCQAVVGWCAQEGIPNNATYTHKLVVCFGSFHWEVEALGIQLVFTILLCQHFGTSLSSKGSNYPIISKLTHHFCLNHLFSWQQCDRWYVKNLLSLLESWDLASCLTDFILTSKRATLLALVMGICCTKLTLLCIVNQHFLLQHNAVTLFLHQLVRRIGWVILHLSFIFNIIPMMIIALYFIWRLIYSVQSLLGRGWMDNKCHVCFLGRVCRTC